MTSSDSTTAAGSGQEPGTTMTLKTRKPTGAVPWPLVLIEGEEKAGKTWACAEFTASPKVGRCFWIDLGEGAADEYGAIPGADYEVVEHDGSFSGLYEAVREIHALAGQALTAGDKPVVLIIDTMTSEWDLLKDWAGDRAKSSKSNRKKLEADPNAEITISGNYWNDANGRHRQLMRLLKTFPGIVLMTSHGKAVAVIGADGQPVEGKKEHKVEAQKTLGADASCWIRLFREHPGVIVGGRSVHLQFRPGEDLKPLARNWTLAGIIFDVLKCDPANAHVRDLVEPKADLVTPEQIRDEALRPVTTFERIKELWAEAKRLGYDDVVLMNESGDDEPLLEMLFRVGKERAPAPAQPAAEQPAEPASHSRDQEWLQSALEQAVIFADDDAGRKLWGEVVAKRDEGQIVLPDAERVKDLIRARWDELATPAAPAGEPGQDEPAEAVTAAAA